VNFRALWASKLTWKSLYFNKKILFARPLGGGPGPPGPSLVYASAEYRNPLGNFSSLNYTIRQSRRDPVIGNSTIPNPGIENSSPGLQSIAAAMVALSSFAHSVLIWCWDQWCVFCTHSLTEWSTRCSQLDLNLANLEATVAVKWTLAFLFPFWWRQTCVTISLCSVVPVVMVHFTICSYFKCQDEFRIRPEITNICWTLSKLCLKY